ncbi:hypothetical protein SS50377_22161 [Spironucleus salmonicida]|uniref:Uncharacterized protein n=1 Tax=Spironucleus salmonicida TaxID=348837 RepID=V6LY23_9EUKA|nr:hypothetical protein SS50377_22161 [Spironucleus salmonicida]|eukprot:EST45679.1 hypothetical protein SS50377_14251 [Spironucleus salmonicida]
MTAPQSPQGMYHSVISSNPQISHPNINPSKSRPDHTTDSRDIIENGPRPHQCIIKRHVDPNEPRYKLASYQTIQPEETPMKYNFAHDITDIQGLTHKSKLINTNLGHIREHTLKNITDCSDISYQRKVEVAVNPREKDQMLDVTDIVRHKKQLERQKCDMLNTRYDWKGAEEMSMEGLSHTVPYRQQLWNSRDYVKTDNMRTDDIIGYKEEKEWKKKFKYGYRDTIIDNTLTDDCSAKRGQKTKIEELTSANKWKETMTRDYNFNQKSTDFASDQIGQEYHNIQAKDRYPKPPSISQTYKNPDFFKSDAQHPQCPGYQTGYLKKVPILERPTDLDPPPYVPAASELVIKKTYPKGTDPRIIPVAGSNLHAHEFSCCPEVVGRLPGPGAECYPIRHDFKRGYQPEPLGDWQKNPNPDRQVSGFSTTWNERREAEKMIPKELLKTTLKRFDHIAPKTFCGQTINQRTVQSVPKDIVRVVPEANKIVYAKVPIEQTMKIVAKEKDMEMVRDLPW